MTLLTIIWLQLLHIYIYSGCSPNIEMLCVMLTVVTHLEAARRGAEVWLEPSLYRFFRTIKMPLSLSLYAFQWYLKYTQTGFPSHIVNRYSIWIISKWTSTHLNSETTPSPDTGQSVTTPVASAAVPVTHWGGTQGLLFHLRGSSKRFGVAVSKCVFASR